jgi:hypothetical protein
LKDVMILNSISKQLLTSLPFPSFQLHLRSTCLAIVDSGTSGLGIPTLYYESILGVVTNGMKCKGVSCINVKESQFPVLLISLDPDSTFPLLPSDYVECSGENQLFHALISC